MQVQQSLKQLIAPLLTLVPRWRASGRWTKQQRALPCGVAAAPADATEVTELAG